MKLLFPILFIFIAICLSACVSTQTLTCYDELGRMSTIIEYDLARPDALVKESGDEFKCEPGMDKYCTTSPGVLVASPASLIVTWTRELTGEESIYEIDRQSLNYMGDYGGAIWQGQCEVN